MSGISCCCCFCGCCCFCRSKALNLITHFSLHLHFVVNFSLLFIQCLLQISDVFLFCFSGFCWISVLFYHQRKVLINFSATWDFVFFFVFSEQAGHFSGVTNNDNVIDIDHAFIEWCKPYPLGNNRKRLFCFFVRPIDKAVGLIWDTGFGVLRRDKVLG